MSNLEEKKIEFIESLIETKAFDKLTKGERNLVLEMMDSSEYESMRILDQQLSKDRKFQYKAVPEPDPNILSEIKKIHFSENKDRSFSGIWNSVVNWKLHIPAYQLGAAALILFFLLLTTYRPTLYIEKPVLVESVVYDTLRVQPEKDTVFVDRYIVREVIREPKPPVELKEAIKATDVEEMVNVEAYLTLVSQNKGFSLKEKAYLLNLNVGND